MLRCSINEGATFSLITLTLLWVFVESLGPIYMTFAESFVHSVSLGSTYSVSDTASGAGATSGNKADDDTCHHGAGVGTGMRRQ